MTLEEILPAMRRLTLDERLMFIEVLARSIRAELSAPPTAEDAVPFAALHGALKQDGPMPTDEELKDNYVDYLIEKYA